MGDFKDSFLDDFNLDNASFDDFGGDGFRPGNSGSQSNSFAGFRDTSANKSDTFGNSSDSFGFDADFGTDNSNDTFDNGFESNASSEFSSVNTSTPGDNPLDLGIDLSEAPTLQDDLSSSNQINDAGSDDSDNDKKKILVVIAVGVIALIIVCITAPLLIKLFNGKADASNSNNQVQVSNNNAQVGNSNTQAAVNNTPIQTTIQSDWIEITSNEDIQFSEEYSDLTFTVTGVKNLAKLVESDGSLVVKSVVYGSISGLSGSYEIEVPYNLGSKLVVGNQFTVHVLLGQYNSKTVVGGIRF